MNQTLTKTELLNPYNHLQLNNQHTIQRKEYVIRAGNFTLNLGKQTNIIGIINATPDSFSKDGCYQNNLDPSQAIDQALRMIEERADVIDIGGESSRPGANFISADEEISRIIPIIKHLANKIKIPISVDTCKTSVAQEALDAGASIINNIQGTNLDDNMLSLIREYKAAVILMHMQGTPSNMQENISYTNVVDDIIALLSQSIEKCLECGINSDRIIIDPGIGFGKTVEHNSEILRRLSAFNTLNKPILIGASRKSFIGQILNKPVQERLLGSLAVAALSVSYGAHLLRVHDVQETKEIITLLDTILDTNNQC